MPIYDYICDDEQHVFEETNKIADRMTSTCKVCGSSAKMYILQAASLDPRMGTDPGFPTAYAKWGKKQWAKATGRMKDSNQTSHGTNIDVDRDAHKMRKATDR